MRIASRVFLGLSAFLVAAGLVYLLTAYEWAGAVQILSASAAFGYLGLITTLASRRAERAAPGGAPSGEEAAVELEHVGPTIWPVGFSVAAVFLALGAAVLRVLLIPGALLFLASVVGWIMDIRHQHASAGRH